MKTFQGDSGIISISSTYRTVPGNKVINALSKAHCCAACCSKRYRTLLQLLLAAVTQLCLSELCYVSVFARPPGRFLVSAPFYTSQSGPTAIAAIHSCSAAAVKPTWSSSANQHALISAACQKNHVNVVGQVEPFILLLILQASLGRFILAPDSVQHWTCDTSFMHSSC